MNRRSFFSTLIGAPAIVKAAQGAEPESAWHCTWPPVKPWTKPWLKRMKAPMDGTYMVTYWPGRYRIMSMKAGEEVNVANGIVYMGPIDPGPIGHG